MLARIGCMGFPECDCEGHPSNWSCPFLLGSFLVTVDISFSAKVIVTGIVYLAVFETIVGRVIGEIEDDLFTVVGIDLDNLPHEVNIISLYNILDKRKPLVRVRFGIWNCSLDNIGATWSILCWSFAKTIDCSEAIQQIQSMYLL